MLYFALNNDGLLYNLGDHKDYDSADYAAQNMRIDPIWIIAESEARSMMDFLNEQLENTISTK
jgi:hypothetical protein